MGYKQYLCSNKTNLNLKRVAGIDRSRLSFCRDVDNRIRNGDSP